MKLRIDEGGWVCSRMERARLHKNVEIRENWKSVANKVRNIGLGVGAGCMVEEG